MNIQIYDTTLRDGTQREGISLSCDDKIKIARKLDTLGMTFIEGGWPGSNPKDAEFFQRIKNIPLKHSVVAAFGSTCRIGGRPEQDANIQALLDSQTQVCTVVGKASTLHVKDVLQTSEEENLRIIRASVAYLVSKGRRVFFDAEHFFDGYKLNRDYALSTLRAANESGAETLVLCDTNGGSMPWEISNIVSNVRASIHSSLGIHAHNDGDCAVANTISAVNQGCTHFQGTINGYGERCGNANLISVMADLELKMGYHCLPSGNLKRLSEIAHFVAEIANLSPDDHAPYVGKSAFAHKGGIHVAAIRRNDESYQHVNPELVGNSKRIVVSELSGRGNLLSKAEEMGLMVEKGSEVSMVLDEIKTLEARGFSFEAADASVAIMMNRQKPGYKPPFELIDFAVNVEHRQGRGLFAEASVKVRVQGNILHTVAEGNGPVHALDAALRKALGSVYPSIHEFHLSDYKVRILDGENGTAAVTRVLIDTQNGTRHWSTVGASANIIEASWRALTDSIEYGLTHNAS